MIISKKKALVIAMGMIGGFAATSASAVTMTFANNGSASAPVPSYTAVSAGCAGPYTAGYTANSEFRMIAPLAAGCAPGGGGEKSIYSTAAGQTWVFNGDVITGGSMTGTTGFPSNPGAASFPGTSAAPSPGTNPTLNQGAPFFGSPFNFLAPTTTSLAGTQYGPAVLSYDSSDNFTVHFNVMEAQWGGTYFPLGSVGGGITFACSGAQTGSFVCLADHLIAGSEDPGNAGFAGWVAQWRVVGSMSELHVPVPAAAWLLGSGLLGLVGVARRKKS